MTIEEAQEECKRRFPIGCKYKTIPYADSKSLIYTLKVDSYTYRISGNMVYAHQGACCLYDNGVFAELVLPKVPKQPKPKKDDFKPLIKLLKEII